MTVQDLSDTDRLLQDYYHLDDGLFERYVFEGHIPKPLAPQERVLVEEHLAECHGCRREVELMQEVLAEFE